MMKRLMFAMIPAAAVMLTLVLSSCSPQERSGVSPLPHNRPSSWEDTRISR